MSKINDGGLAFPAVKSSLMRDHQREPHRFTHDYKTEGGMSLRDWFAGQALTGLLASPRGPANDKSAATAAYLVADAMLQQREHGNG